MDIDTNSRNGTSTMTPGDSLEYEDDTTPNEPIPMDTDMPAHPGLSPTLDEYMPDHPGHSPMLEVQSTTHHRLTISSLCNPSNEDIYVHPHRMDILFNKTLEPVQVPLCVRGCSSESLYTCGSGPLHMHGSYKSKLGVSGPLLHMENMNSLYIFK